MKVTITPGALSGGIRAIASKSMAHRLLIAAALADRQTTIHCGELSRDIEATADCLRQLGSDILYDESEGSFHVTPVPVVKRLKYADPPADTGRQYAAEAGGDDDPDDYPAAGSNAGDDDPDESSYLGDIIRTVREVLGVSRPQEKTTIDVGESGSTLRFLLPVVCALGIRTHIVMHGRLPERPLSPLWEELIAHGCTLTRNEDGSIDTEGRLGGGTFAIAANISSQFISGLLFAIPLLAEPGCIRLTGTVESEGYIRMTIRALEMFGIYTDWKDDIITVKTKKYLSPGSVTVEGDWSNGAFWEAAGMLTDGAVSCTGLDETSLQQDKAIRALKQEICAGNSVIDCRNIPDLVPVMSVLAAVSPGTTTFTHAERLRIKESDRIRSSIDMLTALGAEAEETEDGLKVTGRKSLRGGTVSSAGDHRIAMSAAIASIVCEGPVIIEGAEAVQKSYPDFWEDFERLGGRILKEIAG